MRIITFKSNGTQQAQTAAGRLVTLPPGRYAFSPADGSLVVYRNGSGLSGFWSSLGNGFKRVGSWFGDHFGEIAATGVGLFAVHQNLSLGQQTIAQQQAQAAANAAAQQAAEARAVNTGGFDLQGMLPLILLGIGGYVLLSRK